MTPTADPDELFHQANQLLAQGHASDSLPLYERARQLRPDHPETLTNLGVAHAELGRHDDAIALYDAALRLRPGFAEAHYNRGNALRGAGRFADAVAAYETALQYNAGLLPAYVNRGLALVKLGRVVDAVGSYWQALQRRSDYPEARNNLGLALQYLGRVDEAIDQFDLALRSRPDWPDARTNRAQCLLTVADFRRGWAEYEWRWRLPRVGLPPRPQPRWGGEPLADRAILLRAEQGMGDTIQFIRYAELVKQAGAGRVIVEAPARLHPLLQSCEFVDEFVTRETADVACDVLIPLMSLPGVFKTGFRTIPKRIPYLTAEPERVYMWKAALPRSGLRVGVAWQGNRDFPEDQLRSMPLAAFAPLAAVPNVQLVSLQMGPGTEQVAPLRDRVPLLELGPDLDADGAFLDTAAVMTALDLVVTSDTAIAHLAGALGLPVWVALPVGAEWRWLRDRDDSPWYPTVRLFRQHKPGDWDDVFARIAEALTSQ